MIQINTYTMFMNKKIHYGQNATFFQINLYIQHNNNNKNPACYFVHIYKLILKFLWKY